MKAEIVNRLGVIIASGVLLLYLFLSTVESVCFSPLELLATYAILTYDIVSQIFFLVIE